MGDQARQRPSLQGARSHETRNHRRARCEGEDGGPSATADPRCFWRWDPPGRGRPDLSLGDVPKEILLSPKMRLQRGVPPALQSGSILWSEHVAAQGDGCEGETPLLGWLSHPRDSESSCLPLWSLEEMVSLQRRGKGPISSHSQVPSARRRGVSPRDR